MSTGTLAFAAGCFGLLTAHEVIAGMRPVLAGHSPAMARALAALAHAVIRLGSEGRDPGAVERRRLLAAGALAAFAAGFVALGPLPGLAAAAAGPWAVARLLRARRERYRRAVDEGTAAAAVALADALGGGHSLRGALAEATDAVPGAAGHELRRTRAELAAGARTEDALEALRARARSPRMDGLVAACLLQRRAGGDLARLLRGLARSFEDQSRLEDEVRAATAQARFTGLVVVLLPLAGAGLAELASPGFLTAGSVGTHRLARRHGADPPAGRRCPHPAARARAGVSGWLAPLLTLAAGVLAVLGLAQLAATRSKRARDGSRLVRALAAGGFTLRAVRTLAPPADLRARVAAAGTPGGLGAREVMAVKAGAALTGAGVAVPLAAAAPGRLGPLVVLVGPAAGFLAPDLWLGRRARARAQRARRELPAMLDLLRVTVEAGGSLAASLGAVGERGGGALAVEWRAVAREVALGVGLTDALAAMTQRLPQSEIQALVSALERARRHGAPLAETLEAQARDARFALRRAVQEDAAKAGPKIQLVVALMLVPSVLLLVAAALAAALLGGDASLPVDP